MSYDFDSYSNQNAILIDSMFRLEEADRVINVLGYMLESFKSEPVSLKTLQRIGEYAAGYAKDLVMEQGAVSDIPKEHLKDSIKSRVQNNQLQIYSDIRDPRTQYPYAGSVEYGFHPYGLDKFVSPRPFLRPALQLALELTRGNFEYAVSEVIDHMHDGTFYGLDSFVTGQRGVQSLSALVGTKGHRQASMQSMINYRNQHGKSAQRQESLWSLSSTNDITRGQFGVSNKGAYTSIWKVYGKGREKSYVSNSAHIGKLSKKNKSD